MRTTVTLEDDVVALLTKHMREHGLSFKEALNGLLRTALRSDEPRADVTYPVYRMGQPTVDLTHALRLAHDLDDEERQRQLDVGR